MNWQVFSRSLFTLFIAVMSAQPLFTQATLTIDSTTLTEREVAIGLNIPWEMLYGPDDHLWITERTGKVYRTNPENGLTTMILDIEEQVESGDESGMLGMALHPHFDSIPEVFIVYDYLFMGFLVKARLTKFEWTGDSLINEQLLIDSIPGASSHNGSRLIVGPDEKLYMSTGDAGLPNFTQDPSRLNGKVLRINLDGSIPEDNPFENSYTYSMGHRNPQGLHYATNGRLYETEHGYLDADEINLILPGRNYGWPNVQGYCDDDFEIVYCDTFDIVEPLYEWSPCYAVNDLSYYTNEQIPEWKDKLLVTLLGGSLGTPGISIFELNESGDEISEVDQIFTDYGRIRDIAINPNTGAIYFATNGFSFPSSGPNRIIEYANLDFVSSTNEIDNHSPSIDIFPNPAASINDLNLEVSSHFLDQKYEIYNFEGKLVSSGTIKTKLSKLNPNLTPGSYYLKSKCSSGIITKKFILTE